MISVNVIEVEKRYHGGWEGGIKGKYMFVLDVGKYSKEDIIYTKYHPNQEDCYDTDYYEEWKVVNVHELKLYECEYNKFINQKVDTYDLIKIGLKF